MSETTGSYSITPMDLPSEIPVLRSQAHALIEQLARRPQAVRLLGAAIVSLRSISGYKQGRRRRL